MQLSSAAEPSKFLVALKWYVLLMFCLSAFLCVHFSLLYQIDGCAGNGCASDEQRPSARSILIMQGAANNQDNAMPSEYAKLIPNNNETTVVDVEVAFEM
jgi:hypothetical protein